MLAVHAVWSCAERAVLVWAEDGTLPPALPAGRGRRPGPHPFAASADALAAALAPLPGLGGLATAGAAGTPGEAVVWLPGVRGAPEPSPGLVRSQGTPPGGARAGRRRGLVAFRVPVLRFGPGQGLDALLALTAEEASGPALHVGDSARVLATLGALALEVVAGGRVLPELVVGPGGHEARWSAVGGEADVARIDRLAAALPPVARGLSEAGEEPLGLAHEAFSAFVDAACRDALRAGVGRRGPRPSLPATRDGGAVGAWLTALAVPDARVEADPSALEALAGLVVEWRSGAAGRAGPWRLCLRLCEPEPEPEPEPELELEPEAWTPGGPVPGRSSDPGRGTQLDPDAAAGRTGWRLEFLLQAADEPSLVVGADDVWRAGDVLRRATRTVEDPHEVLLAELGRAVRAFPELAAALREPAPTGLDLDLAGAHRFLSEAAPVLELAGVGVLLPAWWQRPAARLGVRLTDGRDPSAARRAGSGGLGGAGVLADFDWEAAIGDERIGLEDLRRLAELKQPLVRVRGQWTELRPGEAAALADLLGAPPASRRALGVGDVLRAAAGLPDTTALGGVPVLGVDGGGPLGALLRGDLDDALDVRPAPPGFVGELRPYQARGVAWIELLERLGLGACLADDMGLGKTATVLAVVQAERARAEPGTAVPGPTLVVCPTSVVGNWQREAQRFTPALRVAVHHGATRARGEELRAGLEGVDLVVTSYPLVERDRRSLVSVEWARVVLDEAQHVKNPSAKQTRAVRALRAPKRLALTGTPVENHLGDLWSIMEILNPGLLGPASTFHDRLAVPIERYGDEEATERLRTLTGPFVLRRLKTDRAVIADLPEKVEMKVVCTLTKEQATLYQAVVDEMLARIDDTEGIERKGLVLATMLRLKQVCNHPAQYLGDGSRLEGRSGKLERTVEVLEEVVASNERALVFTQFAEMGHLLAAHLAERLGRRVSFLHGGVPRRRRDELVAELQSPGGAVPVMVLSVKAGGTGLNLTAASHVVHFDRWWNPAVETQATDRAYRIGQRRDVQVRTLVCAGTVEERIDRLIEDKRELAGRVVGSGEGWLTRLGTEELADVLRLSAESAVAT